MLYLSLSALKYAANICEEFPKYKIGIALRDISDSKSIIDILKVNIKDIGVKIIINKYNSRIEFSNGSSIKFIFASDNSRGYTIIEYRKNMMAEYCKAKGFEAELDGYKCFAVNMAMISSDDMA